MGAAGTRLKGNTGDRTVSRGPGCRRCFDGAAPGPNQSWPILIYPSGGLPEMFTACYCVASLVAGAWVFPAQDTLPPVRPPTAAALQRLVPIQVVPIRADSFEAIRAAGIIGNDLLLAGVSGSNMYSDVGLYSLATGVLIRRLTRQGSGPGEMRGPRSFRRMAGDSLFVYDDRQRRYTVFSPGSYRYVRSGPVQGLWAGSVIPTTDGRILVAATVASREAVGFPMHLYRPAGEHVASFGSTGRSAVRGTDGDDRAAEVAADGQFWAISLRGPTIIERYTADGKPRQVIPFSREAELPSVQVPGPQTLRLAIVSMDDKHLWILSAIADVNWRRGVLNDPSARASPGSRAMRGEIRIGSYSRFFDSVVDVVDVRTGVIVARRRSDAFITHILPGGYVVAHTESPDGEPVIRVEKWVLRLP